MLCDKCKEINHLFSICSCESLEDRDSDASSSSNVDRPTLVAIENEGAFKEEESISHEENRAITGSDEYGILLRPLEDSLDTTMDLYLCGGSFNTSYSKEKDLNERIYLKKKLIYL